MRVFRLLMAGVAVLAALQPFSRSSAFPVLQAAATQEKDDPTAFTSQVAVRLLDQVKQGLEGRMAKKALGSFDLSRMTGGQSFKDQITAFLDQHESIRVHFNLVETSTTGAESVAIVDVEMEEDQRSDIAAPGHKHAQLRFVAQNTPAGWRFTDVQPRSFFT